MSIITELAARQSSSYDYIRVLTISSFYCINLTYEFSYICILAHSLRFVNILSGGSPGSRNDLANMEITLAYVRSYI